MSQVTFGASTAPLLTDLDANFTELYGKTALLSPQTNALGIGSTPASWGAVSGLRTVQVGGIASISGDATAVRIFNNLYFDVTGVLRYISAGVGLAYVQISGSHIWGTAPSGAAGATATVTSGMTLDSLNRLFIGQNSTGYQNSNSFLLDTFGGFQIASHVTGTASGTLFAGFGYAGSQIGSVTQNGTTGVAYNTSSDYRLKDDVQPLLGSGTFIDSLQPRRWTWKSDGSPGAGFIAHELQQVSPMSVTGTKDAVDPATGQPVYQAVEYGSAEVIANMVSELQALRARLAALEAR
jgi:hypothetical protein